MGKDNEYWAEIERQRKQRAQEKRDKAIQDRLDYEAEIENIKKYSPEASDAEAAELLDMLGADEINEIRNAKYDDPIVRQAAKEIADGIKNPGMFGGRRRKAKNLAKKHKKALKQGIKKNKGCAVVAVMMIGGAASVLSAAGWGTFEIVRHFV